jgi:cytochrome c
MTATRVFTPRAVRTGLIALLAPAAACLAADTQQASGDTDGLSGEQAFAACSACHSLSPGAAHKVGPSLAGVFGRRAATAPDYAYSPALKASGLVWTRENLFVWIAGSEAMVPGSWMLYHNQLRADEVMALIDYMSEAGN